MIFDRLFRIGRRSGKHRLDCGCLGTCGVDATVSWRSHEPCRRLPTPLITLLVAVWFASSTAFGQASDSLPAFDMLQVDLEILQTTTGETLVTLADSNLTLGHLALCPSYDTHYRLLDDRIASVDALEMFTLEDDLTGDLVLRNRNPAVNAMQNYASSPYTVVVPVVAWAVNITSVNLSAPDAAPWQCLQQSFIAIYVRFHFPLVPPLFPRQQYEANVYEDAPVGTTLYGLIDLKPQASYPVSYMLQSTTDPVEVQQSSGGFVHLVTTADQRNYSAYDVTIIARAERDNETVDTAILIMVTVDSVNEHTPVFGQQRYNFTLPEDALLGTAISLLEATDGDTGYDGQLYFVIQEDVPFAVQATSGLLTTSSILDYETQSTWSFNVSVLDRGQPPKIATASVFVAVQNVNEFYPVVVAQPSAITVPEEGGPGTLLTQLTVRDGDYTSPEAVSLKGVLVNGEPSDLATVRLVQGNVTNGKNLEYSYELLTGSEPMDREMFPNGVVIDVLVIDNSSPTHRVTFPISVMLDDINDHIPVLASSHVEVSEAVPANTPVFIFSAVDPDEGPNGMVSFNLENLENAPFRLGLQRDNRAVLLTTSALDREAVNNYTFDVTVSDGGSPSLQTQASVLVTVGDINDNAPVFIQASYASVMPEDADVGYSITMVTAADADIGSNSRLRFSILSQLSAEFFAVDAVTGEVRLQKQIDYETDPRGLFMIVQATDLGSPYALSATVWVNVTVTDIDDTPPLLSSTRYTCLIEENRIIHPPCVQVHASDIDSLSLNYSLDGADSAFFSIDENGLVYSTTSFDREFRETYELSVMVTDGNLDSFASVLVKIVDTNDNSPVLSGPFNVDILDTVDADEVVLKVTATDVDVGENGLIVMTSPQDDDLAFPFVLDAFDHMIRVKTGAQFNQPSYTFLVTACDNGQPRMCAINGIQAYTLNVLDVNRPPEFVQPLFFRILQDTVLPGTGVLAIRAADPDENDFLTYSLQGSSDCFTLNSVSGELSISNLTVPGASPRTTPPSTPSATSSFPSATNSSQQNATNSSQPNATNGSQPTMQSPLSQCIGRHVMTVNVEDSAGASTSVQVVVDILSNVSDEVCTNRLSENIFVVVEGDALVAEPLVDIGNESATEMYTLENFDGTAVNDFRVNASGEIYATVSLSRTLGEWYSLVAVITYQEGDLTRQARCEFTVNVREDADIVPDVADHYVTNVWDISPVGTRVIQIMETSGRHRPCCLRYFTPADEVSLFAVDSYTGVVSVASNLPTGFPQFSSNVTIIVHPDGFPSSNVTTIVTLIIDRIDVQPPAFAANLPREIQIHSGLAIGEPIGKFPAENNSASLNVIYSIGAGVGAGNFTVNSSTGEVAIAVLLPEISSYTIDLVIVATSDSPLPKSSRHEVTVRIRLGNRFPPRFGLDTYYVQVPEDTLPAHIFTLNAFDDDSRLGPSNQNGQVSINCSLRFDDPNPIFTFASSIGQFSVIRSVLGRVGEVVVLCGANDVPRDPTETKYSQTVRVVIQVHDVNDRSPELVVNTMNLEVEENTLAAGQYSVLNSSDGDLAFNSQLVYQLLTPTVDYLVDPFSGAIQLVPFKSSGSNGRTPIQTLEIRSNDLGSPSRTSNVATVVVRVEDVNDNPTIFQPAIQHFTTSLAIQPGSQIGIPAVTDSDTSPLHHRAVFQLVETVTSLFGVHPFTGAIQVLEPLPSQPAEHYLLIRAQNGNLVSYGRVVITVQPTSPATPKCRPHSETVIVNEDLPVGGVAYHVHCDRDSQRSNGELLTITALTGSSSFVSLPNSLTIVSAAILDHRRYSHHDLHLQVSQGNSEPTDLNIRIVVMSVPSNRLIPRLLPDDFIYLNISENTQVGKFGYLTANDNDPAGPDSNITYHLNYGTATRSILVDPQTGELELQHALDREASTFKQLSAIVSVSDQGEPRLRSLARVQIVVTDIDDNAATFSHGMYELTLSESDLVYPRRTTFIAAIAARDADSGLKAGVRFSLNSDASRMGFELVTVSENIALLVTSKEMVVTAGLGNVQVIEVMASDNASPQLLASTFIRISVSDTINNHGILCDERTSVFSYYSNVIPNFVVSHLFSVDLDSGKEGNFRYLNITGSGLLAMNLTTGVITVTRIITPPAESMVFTDYVYAEDMATPPRISRCPLTVTLIRASTRNIATPQFRRSNYAFQLPETAKVGTVVGTVGVLPHELATHCLVINQVAADVFVLAPNSGVLLLARSVKGMVGQSYHFIVECARAGPFVEVSTSVEIISAPPPVMYFRPKFLRRLYEYHLEGNLPSANETIGCVEATADSASTNADLRYSYPHHATVLSFTCQSGYCLNAITGCLHSSDNITPAGMPRVDTLTVCAKEAVSPDSPDLIDCTQVLLTVPAVNLNTPQFARTLYTSRIDAVAANGAYIMTVQAVDGDFGVNGELTYSILNPAVPFMVHPRTGVVILNGSLDMQRQSNYHATIRVEDSGQPTRFSTTEISITVDVEEEVSLSISQQMYTWFLKENQPAGTLVGTVLTESTHPVNLSIISASDSFLLEPHTGHLLTRKVIDYEVDQFFEFIVVASIDGIRPLQASVQINVMDENDNFPSLILPAGPITISASHSVNSTIAHFLATDADSDENGRLFLSLLSATNDMISFFRISPTTGDILLTRPLESTPARSTVLDLLAEDNGPVRKRTVQSLTIVIEDVNRHPPTFPENGFNVTYPHLLPADSQLLRAVAVDLDTNAQLEYTIIGGEFENFQLDNKSAAIHLTINYDLREAYHFVIQVSDGLHTAATNVSVNFQPVTDIDLVFAEAAFMPEVSELAPVGTSVTTLTVSDFLQNPSSTGRTYRYRMLPPRDQFIVEEDTGVVRVAGALDREQQPVREFRVQVVDADEPLRVNVGLIRVRLLDGNDNYPLFMPGSYRYSAADDTPIGGSVLQLSISDADIGTNANVSFHLISGDQQGFFMLEQFTGVLRTKRLLHTLAINMFTLFVRVSDHGVPSLSSTQQLDIVVQDSNRPVFDSSLHNLSLPENITVVAFLLQVHAVSPVDSSLIEYSIQSGDPDMFSLESGTGRLFLTRTLDFERERSHSVIIRASVPIDGNPNVFDDTIVYITVLDVNDNKPSFQRPLYTVTLDEHLIPNFLLWQLLASDRDSSLAGTVEIALQDAPDVIQFYPGNGSIFLTQELDFEQNQSYPWTAIATDFGNPPQMTTVQIRLFVSNINDNPPKFVIPFQNITIVEGRVVTEVVASVSATDRDGILNPLVYKLLDDSSPSGAQFAVASETGLVTINEPNVGERPFYRLNISVTDGRFQDFAIVEISVTEQNDFAPAFDSNQYPLTLLEPIVPGTQIAHVNAVDGDRGLLGNFTYILQRTHSENLFTLDSHTGIVLVVGRIEFDTQRPTTGNVYVLTIVAEDGGGRRGFTSVVLTVEDRNECAPKFTEKVVPTIRISENLDGGTLLISSLPTMDCDFGLNAQVTYNLSAPDPTGEFNVDPITGQLTLARRIVGIGVRQFLIQASDHGQPQLSNTIPITVAVVPAADAPPILNQTLFSLEFNEDFDNPGMFLFQVHAFTGNPDNLPLRYSWRFGDEGDFRQVLAVLQLNLSTGEVFLVNVPPFAFVQEIRTQIEVEDRHGGRASASVIVRILQTQRNLNPPIFDDSVYEATIYENEPIGTMLRHITAIIAFDADDGAGGEIVYFLESPADQVSFTFNTTSLTGFSADVFDREVEDSYSFLISARDNGSPSRVATPASVAVQVLDRNDNPPFFSRRLYRGTIAENSVAGVIVDTTGETGPLVVSDADLISILEFTITHGNMDSVQQGPIFRIDSTGNILLLGDFLDYERQTVYQLNVTVSDQIFTDYCMVEVILSDMNDNAPKFPSLLMEASVPETLIMGVSVLDINATDADSALFDPLTYSLDFESNEFRIDPVTGIVSTRVTLDREVQHEYAIIVRVEDGGGLSAASTVRIFVLDVNDNDPFFIGTPYAHTLFENNGFPGAILQVRADDADIGINANLSFSLVNDGNGSFAVPDENVGIIAVVAELDREVVSHYDLIVEVADRGEPMRSARAMIGVDVMDVNDNSPVFTDAMMTAIVNETASRLTTFYRVIAIDADAGAFGTVRYDIADGDGLFEIDSNTGALFLNQEGVLDFERIINYTVTVLASDGDLPPRQTISPVLINVRDNNDNRPRFEFNRYSSGVFENRPPGISVFQLSATDADSGSNAELSYSLGNASVPFSINASSGVVYTIGVIDREVVPTYFLEVLATDHGSIPGSLSGSTILQVLIGDENDNKPTIVSPANFSFHPTFENDISGEPIMMVISFDADAGENSDIEYTVNDTELFRMEGSGLVANVPFDFEGRREYGVFVRGRDRGRQPFNTTNFVEFTITVEDVDDQPPFGRHTSAMITQIGNMTTNDTIACLDVDDIDKNVSTYSYRVHSNQPSGDYFAFGLPNCSLILAPGPAIPVSLYEVQSQVTDAAGSTLSNATVCVRHVTSSQLTNSVSFVVAASSVQHFAQSTVTFNCNTRSRVSQAVADILLLESGVMPRDTDVHMFSIQKLDASHLVVSVAANIPRLFFLDIVQRHLPILSQQIGFTVESLSARECSDSSCNSTGHFSCQLVEQYGQKSSAAINLGSFSFQSHDRTTTSRCTCHPAHIHTNITGNSSITSCRDQVQNPCLSGPCLAGGRCVVARDTAQGFQCACPTGTTGEYCQVSLRSPGQAEQCDTYGQACLPTGTARFSSTSSLLLNRLNITRLHSVSFQIRMEETSALLLYASELAVLPGADFIAVYVVNGFLTLTMSSGQQPRSIQISSRVDDGQWHFVHITVTMQVCALGHIVSVYMRCSLLTCQYALVWNESLFDERLLGWFSRMHKF